VSGASDANHIDILVASYRTRGPFCRRGRRPLDHRTVLEKLGDRDRPRLESGNDSLQVRQSRRNRPRPATTRVTSDNPSQGCFGVNRCRQSHGDSDTQELSATAARLQSYRRRGQRARAVARLSRRTRATARMGYFVLTLMTAAAGSQKKAAAVFQIDIKVLKKIGELTSTTAIRRRRERFRFKN